MYLDGYLSLALSCLGGASPVGRIPILMYHSISDTDESGVSPYFRLCTSPDRFRSQMRWLRAEGYESVYPDVFYTENRDSIPDKPVIITFDDGFRDNYTAALPILAEFGFGAMIYLPTAFIGQERGEFGKKECLTWSEVRELRSKGIRFGSHTVDHPKLIDLDRAEVDRQLKESKESLEEQLGESILDFAYPYAFPEQDKEFVEFFEAALEDCGYQSSMTTQIGLSSLSSSRYSLKRIPVNSMDSDRIFQAKMTGAYDWLGWIQTAKKRVICF